MKILVTGCTGFIGSHLVPRLARKHDVRCLVRKTSNTSMIEKFCELSCGDITSAESVRKAAKGCDAVVHMAVILGYGNYQQNYEVQVNGMRNVIAACKSAGIERIISYSSVAALAERKTYYGLTKAIADSVLQESGLEWTILHPDFVYGPGSRPMKLLVDMFRRYPFIIILGSGNYRKQPVYVHDVVQATLACARGRKSAGKHYILASQHPITFNEMAKTICRQYGIGKPVVHVPAYAVRIAGKLMFLMKERPVNDINIYGLMQDCANDISAAQRDLGFRPISFEEGIMLMDVS